MLDLDHFKRINDTRGHEVGDQVLRLFSDVLLYHRRSGDLAARVGGEEFALLLPYTDRVGAIQIEQRLRVSLHDACELHPSLNVDYSSGLAMLNANDASLTAFMVRAIRPCTVPSTKGAAVWSWLANFTEGRNKDAFMGLATECAFLLRQPCHSFGQNPTAALLNWLAL